MFQGIYNFLVHNPGNIMTILPLAMMIFGAFIFWIERKIFINLLKKTNKLVLIGLVLIITSFCLISAFNFKSFSPSDEEWWDLNLAKKILSGDRTAFPNQHGMVYPLIVAIGFKIFGLSPYVASRINLFLAALSIFLVFLLSKIIFKKDLAGLLSAIFYSFTPLVFYFTNLRMGFPTTVSFFFLLTILVSILSFKYHKLSLYILSLVLLGLMSQLKPEYFILVFPYLFCFIIFKEYKFLSFKKASILILLFLLFSTPFFVENVAFKENFTGWCGTPSQIFYEGKIHSYSLPVADQLDKVLKFLANDRFSFSYLIYDLPNFAKFWTSKSFTFVLPFILLGIIFSFQKAYRKETLFLLLSFLSISAVYLADCAFYEPRYAIPSYGLLVVFSGFALEFLINKFYKKRGEIFFKILPIILISLLVFNFLNFFQRYKNFSDEPASTDYQRLKKITSDFSPENSYIIVPHQNEAQILRFLGYKSSSLTDLVDSPYFEDKERFFESLKLPVNPAKNSYFISSWHCQTLKVLEDTCNFIIRNFTKKVVARREESTIYLLKNENQKTN